MRCEECGKEPDVHAHATGWVAYLVDLTDDPNESDETEVIVYCPECAAQEFGRRPKPSDP